MRSLKTWCAVAGCLLVFGLVAEQADAQGGRRGGGGFMRGMGAQGAQSNLEVNLLEIKEVVKHLEEKFELTGDKLQQLKDMVKEAAGEIREERNSAFRDFRNLSEEERTDAMKDFQQNVGDINRDMMKKAKGLLSKEQLNRLNELKIQRMGMGVVRDKAIQDLLGITEDQIKKMDALKTKMDEERQKLISEMRDAMAGGDREGMREMMTEMREQMTAMQKKMEEATMKVLTKEQSEAITKMKGEKFEFPQRQRGRRGPGR